MRVGGKNLGYGHKACSSKKKSRRQHSKSVRRSGKMEWHRTSKETQRR